MCPPTSCPSASPWPSWARSWCSWWDCSADASQETRAGVIAAALAAVYPNFWIPNGIVMSETLSTPAMARSSSPHRLPTDPGWPTPRSAGSPCGSRRRPGRVGASEPFLLVPAALTCRGVGGRARMGLAALAVGASLLTVGPWVGRNLATFSDVTYISTGDGPVLLGANCPGTYYGPLIGLWSLSSRVTCRPDPISR